MTLEDVYNNSENQDKQKESIEKLINLSQKYPNLRILPMVDGELSGYEYSYYEGSFGYVELDEVFYKGDRIYFRSEDTEELEECYYISLKENNPVWSDTYLDEQALQKVNSLEWEKVIVLKIGMP